MWYAEKTDPPADAQPVEDKGFEDDVMKIMMDHSSRMVSLYLKTLFSVSRAF